MNNSRRSKVLAATLALVVGVTGAASLSFAASLNLGPAFAPLALTQERCTNQPVSVEMVGDLAEFRLPDECVGEAVVLHAGSAGGQLAVQLVGERENAVTLPDGALPEGVLITSRSWPLMTEWNFEPVPVPDGSLVSCEIPVGTCEVVEQKLSSWVGTGPEYQLLIRIDSSVPEPQQWKVTINLSSPELPFLASGLTDLQGGVVKVSDSGCDADPRTVTVAGTTQWWQQDFVGEGMPPRTIQVEGNQTGTGNLLSCP